MAFLFAAGRVARIAPVPAFSINAGNKNGTLRSCYVTLLQDCFPRYHGVHQGKA